MPHQILKVAERGMMDTFEATLKTRGYVADASQRAAALRLQQLYTELIGFKAARRTQWRKLLSRAQPPRGVYFWGGVGRGKSFLMDCFYDAVPYRRKRRVHFHAFMQQVHEALRQHKADPDPLASVADELARATRLLCFDEFHVSDIADAMILGRLVDALFERGVVFVATSNYPPDGLYPNGLQRQNFLPTIELLKKRLEVFELDAGTDYRLRSLERMDMYVVPGGAQADAKLASDFVQICGEPCPPGPLEILGRQLKTRDRSLGAAWFDFTEICGGPRSQNDYLELARRYHSILVSNIPKMGRDQANEARRFTWLVDVLYDFRVKLIVSADVEAQDLYTDGPHANEFTRTVSRLIEMRTRDYLASAHRVDFDGAPQAAA
ncbi:MAG: AFG1 family ATPase [Gammaproteobacteria bacterium]|jgi:cell division protein ZapE|nr:AFG1 family ATPase [Gammaproteobacteria bacterium]MBU0773355.1 AFG1 family ATPase [Gammaproteobacteria bacterium]MBU0854747.1 AFG1 family ATPase [Gammaproteobacteria bacterium]MBU1846677.1 AFG1 family ATPase [Gammaproteobacteria bacterium]